ncbi:hypothetical protein BU26DRAFT_205859 [Trematosphaeria pertusa]|uniref:Uncharacterized protein n=1 Tax=Trematosphaeria pertusa TaxID=390896 RepID=A0A6A6HSQ0_9PLEO|nr:uncharacterized protein BU26DRAFT_205859 [Trematosphaeria pertusa]KAF2240460.1 hypothetical protein BU26DRAFT_205859 [Trematosphaeria pertusa]
MPLAPSVGRAQHCSGWSRTVQLAVRHGNVCTPSRRLFLIAPAALGRRVSTNCPGGPRVTVCPGGVLTLTNRVPVITLNASDGAPANRWACTPRPHGMLDTAILPPLVAAIYLARPARHNPLPYVLCCTHSTRSVRLARRPESRGRRTAAPTHSPSSPPTREPVPQYRDTLQIRSLGTGCGGSSSTRGQRRPGSGGCAQLTMQAGEARTSPHGACEGLYHLSPRPSSQHRNSCSLPCPCRPPSVSFDALRPSSWSVLHPFQIRCPPRG